MFIPEDRSYHSLSSKEWIITNGIGGYASSSLCGANTRRYHGLLVAALRPPVDRRVIFSKLEETVIIGEERICISTNQYQGLVHPEGFLYLKNFERDPLPKFTFSDSNWILQKTIFMIHGRNITVIEYENPGNATIHLELTPLFAGRDYHHLKRESSHGGLEISSFEKSDSKPFMSGVKIIPDLTKEPYFIFYEKGRFNSHPDWYRNFEYQREIERGLDHAEDLHSIGNIFLELSPGEKASILLSADEQLPEGDPSAWKTYELLRLRDLIMPGTQGFLRDLIISGDQFLVWRLSSRSHSMIAGYHWFTDWGRDTMIAMRGLVIATGKKETAESIILTFLQYLDEGLIPNRFPDRGEQPEYNTMDATLWLFIVLHEYFQKFGDIGFIEQTFPSLTSIIHAHEAGTKYEIHVTGKGLLSGGASDIQLTWMDAKVNNDVVTPRSGCPVEINTLWFNALHIYLDFGKILKKELKEFENKIEKTREAFRKYFINEKGYLNDVVVPGELVDDSIRPNQIYAISLPFSPLTSQECMRVLKIIDEHLYTDFGLRSLSKFHQDFKPVYEGDQWQRDHAYHQGTVWTYLWGEYAIAYLKTHSYSAEARKEIGIRSKALENHFYNDAGVHAVSEIFDGEAPYKSKGCIQQAWSVGMLIKALMETGEY